MLRSLKRLKLILLLLIWLMSTDFILLICQCFSFCGTGNNLALNLASPASTKPEFLFRFAWVAFSGGNACRMQHALYFLPWPWFTALWPQHAYSPERLHVLLQVGSWREGGGVNPLLKWLPLLASASQPHMWVNPYWLDHQVKIKLLMHPYPRMGKLQYISFAFGFRSTLILSFDLECGNGRLSIKFVSAGFHLRLWCVGKDVFAKS